MAASQYYDQVQKVYIAYYGRPADPVGLEFWATKLDGAAGNLNAIIDAFGNSAESNALYGNQSFEAKVNAIYQQLFNREADTSGLLFYTGLLSAQPPKATLASIALDILNGAIGTDKTAVEAKLVAANGFTDALDTTAEILKYSGDWAAQQARDWLHPVTQPGQGGDPQTKIDHIVAGPDPMPVGSVLTTAIDTVVLAAGDVVRGGTETLTQGDKITGPGSVELSLASKADLYSGTTITGASKVTIKPTGDVSITTKDWTDLKQVQIEKIKGDVSLLDLQGANTQYDLVDAINADDKITLNFDGQNIKGKAANVSVKEVNATVEINTDPNFDVETINLKINDDKAGFESNLTDLIGDGTKTLNITGGQAGLSFGIVGALDSTLTTIDASTVAANLHLNISESDQDVNVKLGSGNDVLNVGDTLRTGDVIDGGAGADKIIASFNANSTVGESNRAPTISRVETLDATFVNSVQLYGTNITDLATIDLQKSSGRADFNDFKNDLKTLNIKGDLAQGVEVDYNGEGLTTLDINIEGKTAAIGNAGNPAGIRVINADKVTLNHNGTESVTIASGLQVDESFSGRYTKDLSITNNSAGDLTVLANNGQSSAIIDGNTVERLTIKSTNVGDIRLGDEYHSLMARAANLQHLVVQSSTASDITIGQVGNWKAAGDLETVKIGAGIASTVTSWGIDAADWNDKSATVTSIDVTAANSAHVHLNGSSGNQSLLADSATSTYGGNWLEAASVNLLNVKVDAQASVDGNAGGTAHGYGLGYGGNDVFNNYDHLVRLDLNAQAGADSKLILSGAGSVTGFAFADETISTIDASGLKGSGVKIIAEYAGAKGFTFLGSNQGDTVYTSNGASVLKGGSGSDWFVGGDGNDQIFGGAGNDYLYGGAGNDKIDGGDGDDFIAGGLGSDWLTGGAGADKFYFNFDSNHFGEAGKSTRVDLKQDYITDFTFGEDKIEIDVSNPGFVNGHFSIQIVNGSNPGTIYTGNPLDIFPEIVARVGTYNTDGTFNYNSSGSDVQLLFRNEGQSFSPLDANGNNAFNLADHEIALLGAANKLGSIAASDFSWV